MATEESRRRLVVGVMGVLVAAAVCAFGASAGRAATPAALLAPAKAAAQARLVGLAQRDTERLGALSDETPSALQTLDPVARTISLSEDDSIIARARKEVLAAQKKMARMSLFKGSSTTKQAAKKPVVKPSVELHRAVEAHFGLVYSKAATPKELLGRVTMLAKGPKVESSSGGSKQMSLAERDNKKLARSQAKAAGEIKHFAATLLSSQRKAADELHDLEKHFGR